MKSYLHAVLLVSGAVIATWLAPVARGGIASLALYAAWAIGLMILILTMIAFVMDSPLDTPTQVPSTLRWIFIISWWSAVAWAAYHGMYGLAALHTLTPMMVRLDHIRKTRERGNL